MIQLKISNQIPTYSPMCGSANQAMKSGSEFSKQLSKSQSTRTADYFSRSAIRFQGESSLTPMDIQELNQNYDPESMTASQYDSFLEKLQEKGILTLEEMEMIGYHNKMAGVSGVYDGPLAWSLEDANGDALRFISDMAGTKGKSLTLDGKPNHKADEIASVYEKVLNVFGQMRGYR